MPELACDHNTRALLAHMKEEEAAEIFESRAARAINS